MSNNPKNQDLVVVVVLAAGAGQRFSEDSRYSSTHKTLVPVFGEAMSIFSYRNTVNNLEDLSFATLFVTSAAVIELEPDFKDLVFSVVPAKDGTRVINQGNYVNGQGATTKPLELLIRPVDPVLFVNADQYVVGNYTDAILEILDSEDLDGALFCFDSTEDRYSYVTVDADMTATGMVEKIVTGNIASTGACLWRRTSDYYEALGAVVKDSSEEIYLSDVHDVAIKAGKKFKVFMVESFIDLGTPADLDNLEEKWKTISK
jgi:dTDP-glucose pyrophosphorylase